jgi:hypothetical protein
MQILYLLPPALLLWVTFRDRNDSFVILIPVVVMAAGQLAGGLAWLSISGEDAPDLVATAPITSHRILWAKVEAVIGMIALVFSPVVAVLTLDAIFAGIVCGVGILSAAAAATVIQLCFRVQARRSQFRRRQTSIPPGHIRRGVLLDRLGSDNRSGGRAILGGDRHCRNRFRHSVWRLADQPIADLTFKRAPCASVAARPIFRAQAD